MGRDPRDTEVAGAELGRVAVKEQGNRLTRHSQEGGSIRIAVLLEGGPADLVEQVLLAKAALASQLDAGHRPGGCFQGEARSAPLWPSSGACRI